MIGVIINLKKRMTIEKSNIFKVDKQSQGQRLDNFLIKNLKGLPKSLVYKLVRSGQVRVNKGRTRVSYRLEANDLIRIPPYLLKDEVISSNIQINSSSFIHYQNDDFILINKPYGIAVHSGTNQKYDFLSSLKLSENTKDLSLVNRLDKNTSGCLLVAKNYQAASHLGKEFMNRNVKKKYFALLTGHLGKDIIEIESRITKDSKKRRMTIDKNLGNDAYTKITLIKQFKFNCLVEIEIETGRTHQIRLHTASIGHAIVGDRKYNDNNSNEINKLIGLRRIFLHSYYLSFYYKDEYEFILDLPDDLKEVLSTIEVNNERK
tara:strand:+ start:234 stop:1190 length:957 start_codon:yes stop_codon:yes gene_type:complete